MRRKAAPIAIALLLCAVPAGCGESGPKRAVDARTEVIRFFAVDAPVVALVRTDPPDAAIALNAAADGSPTWSDLRNLGFEPLRAAGIGPPQLARLIRPSAKVEGLDASAIALGAAAPVDLAAQRPLFVLATDQSQLMSRLLRGAAKRGALRRAGSLDEAALYRGTGASFAVRDGVLVSAGRLADVRTAIARRDGDRDQQLDEDVVESLFNDLDVQGPLLVYANLAAIREDDPGVRELAGRTPWTEKLGQSAATARAVGGRIEIEGLSKPSGGDLNLAEVGLGTSPSPVTLTASGVSSLIPAPGPARTLLSSLAPAAGQATASSDEVRTNLTLGR
jgi:hypothetical protein